MTNNSKYREVCKRLIELSPTNPHCISITIQPDHSMTVCYKNTLFSSFLLHTYNVSILAFTFPEECWSECIGMTTQTHIHVGYRFYWYGNGGDSKLKTEPNNRLIQHKNVFRMLVLYSPSHSILIRIELLMRCFFRYLMMHIC